MKFSCGTFHKNYIFVLVAGWGSLTPNELHDIMNHVDLPIVPNDQCQDLLRKTSLTRRFKLHESFICAGGEEGKDSCYGDGGGPLVCPSISDPKRYCTCCHVL